MAGLRKSDMIRNIERWQLQEAIKTAIKDYLKYVLLPALAATSIIGFIIWLIFAR